MKKIVFTLQVFGLVLMLPIYVTLEMNHGTGSVAENNSRDVTTGKIIKTGIGQSSNKEIQNKESVFFFTQKFLLLTTGF